MLNSFLPTPSMLIFVRRVVYPSLAALRPVLREKKSKTIFAKLV